MAAKMDGVSGRVVVRRSPEFLLDAPIEAPGGGVTAIMGPSGAGKSTLLEVLAGYVPPTDGEVRVGAETVSPRHPLDRRRAGVVLLGQRSLLFPHLSVRENTAFGLRARGMRHKEALRRAEAWLERVGLAETGGRRPAELSGGQQQRVALARALATGPRLLLLDEPLSSLDAVTASEIRGVLRDQLDATGTTTLLVTHDAFDAAALAQRMLVIEDGRVTQSGGVREVLENPATRFAAAAAGLNRLHGVARSGAWSPADDASTVRIASTQPAPVPDGDGLIAVFRPADANLALGEDAAGWPARVERLEPSPGGARVHVTDPDLIVEITSAQVAELGIRPGDPVRVAVGPEHVRLLPSSRPEGPEAARRLS